MIIRKADKTDLENIMKLYRSCVAGMIKNGIDQWDESYPNPEIIIADLQAATYYVAQIKEEIIGGINIDQNQDKTYLDINWEDAMTGEITLKGRVLPIGGLKEKLLAAIRYGIKTVIIPKENEKDLIEIQKDIQNKLTIKKVEFAREVLDIALDGKINKINKKLDWRHIVSESMKQKNQQNQEKSY